MKNAGKYTWVLFLLLFVFLFLAGTGLPILEYPPRTTHVFRQSDSYAYTRTYFQHHNSFWQPECYNLLGKDGKVASEFPIMYYLTAQICRITGLHFWAIRGVTLLTCLVGLFYLLAIVRRYVKGVLLSVFPVVILITTPYFFFYATNFLPNVPAIAISIAGLYYMLRYRFEGRRGAIVAATVLFGIAIIIKPTDGGLLWAAMMCTTVVELLRKKIDRSKGRRMLLSAGVVLVVFVAWTMYVRYYNELNGNQINLQGLYPIWDMHWGEVVTTYTDGVMGVWYPDYQHPWVLLLLLGFVIVYIVKWRRIDPFLRTFTLFTILGVIGYAPLWYKAFGVHDYYQLIFVLPTTFIAISALHYYERNVQPRVGKDTKVTIGLSLVLLMVLAIYHNQARMLYRYDDDRVGYANTRIYEVEPYLRQIGITENDIVMSAPDGAPNITLAAYGNRGFTSDLFGIGNYTVPYCREHGAKYLIITDAALLTDSAYVPYLTHKIGQYKDIYIYDIAATK